MREGEGAGWRSAARLLGLGARARSVAVGVDGVKKGALRGKVHLAIIASNAAQNSLDKIVPLLRARGVTLLVGPDVQALGEAVGRPAVAAIGVMDKHLADGIVQAIETSPHAGELGAGIEQA